MRICLLLSYKHSKTRRNVGIVFCLSRIWPFAVRICPNTSIAWRGSFDTNGDHHDSFQQSKSGRNQAASDLIGPTPTAFICSPENGNHHLVCCYHRLGILQANKLCVSTTSQVVVSSLVGNDGYISLNTCDLGNLVF